MIDCFVKCNFNLRQTEDGITTIEFYDNWVTATANKDFVIQLKAYTKALNHL